MALNHKKDVTGGGRSALGEAEAGGYLSSRLGWSTEVVSYRTAQATQRDPVLK